MDFIIMCPHCNSDVIIESINCGIFRHGINISNYMQLNPHENEFNILNLINKNLIFGCGKPFQIILENNNYIAVKCGYI